MTSASSALRASIGAGAASYRYYRWGSMTPAQVQVAEVQLMISGTDQIPTMTSGTTGGVTMTGDSVFSSPSQDPWHAGANDGTTGLFGSNGSSGACFLKVDFGSAMAITSYSVQCHSSTGFAPTAWTFAGSNDDSSYTTLDTRSGLSWSASEVKTFSSWAP